MGNPGVLDRSSAYWAHKYVANLAQLRHNAMIVDIVKSQKHWEAAGVALVDTIRSGAEVVRDAAALRTALDAHAAAVLGAVETLKGLQAAVDGKASLVALTAMHACRFCGSSHASKTKLFNHLRESYACAAAAVAENPDAAT